MLYKIFPVLLCFFKNGRNSETSTSLLLTIMNLTTMTRIFCPALNWPILFSLVVDHLKVAFYFMQNYLYHNKFEFWTWKWTCELFHVKTCLDTFKANCNLETVTCRTSGVTITVSWGLHVPQCKNLWRFSLFCSYF